MRGSVRERVLGSDDSVALGEVAVSLADEHVGKAATDGDGQPLATTTDANGRFEFEGVGAGTYGLVVGAFGVGAALSLPAHAPDADRGTPGTLVVRDGESLEVGTVVVDAQGHAAVLEGEPEYCR